MSKVCQLFSGSSGNSIFVSSKGVNILIDIGVSAKRCENALKNIDVDPSSIDAIFVTHEHKDHSAGLRVFSTRFDVPVFANPQTMEEMYLTGLVNNRVKTKRISEVLDIKDVIVEPFELSHDSVFCQGYRLNLPDKKSVSICTDTGYVPDNAKSVMKKSDLVFLESNHEVSMVENGPYPYFLKERILSKHGHLSNFDSSEFSKELVNSGTSRIVLSHLSRENNSSYLARQTTVSALTEINATQDTDYRLYISPPENVKGVIVL